MNKKEGENMSDDSQNYQDKFSKFANRPLNPNPQPFKGRITKGSIHTTPAVKLHSNASPEKTITAIKRHVDMQRAKQLGIVKTHKPIAPAV